MRTGCCLLLVACQSGPIGTVPDATPDAAPPPAVQVAITATVDSTRFTTREAMLAAAEMQISGEPLAEAMGRDKRRYSRSFLPVDLYLDPVLDRFWIDLAGFATAVESYEYSKQTMNAVAFELGAGTSLVYGPLVNAGETGPAATAKLAARVQHFAEGTNALGQFVFPAGTFPVGNRTGDVNPTGTGLPANNPLGWPGLWPTLHPFVEFDPAIDPTSAEDLDCSITSDDSPGGGGAVQQCADYECDASSLHLRARAPSPIGPGADGFATWKYALWTLNYLQSMHDVLETPVDLVAAGDLGAVGGAGNTVMGDNAGGVETFPGTYLGSSNIEGFQAQLFLQMADERAEDWLAHLATSDGATLGGFPTLAAALAYDYAAPLRWFPRRVAVTETDDGSGFPHPHYALADGGSDLLDLVGLALGFATTFAATDPRNPGVGGAQAARAYFDGDPFATDDGAADGEPTLHDRALAMIRVAVIDLDRMHAGGTVDAAGGHTVATTSLAYTVIGLRTVQRALSAQLALYSNNTPDTAVAATPLDALPIHFPGDPALAFTGRIAQLVRADAALLYDHLTDASGRAFAGWDSAAGAVVDTSDTLDAHAAAIRGLFAAYLATGDTRYRTRAIAVFDRMQAVFYDAGARIYAATPAPVDSVAFTPLRFALVQSTLRDVYELVASRPGEEAREPVLEALIARLDKLVLNGWDDRDRDQRVSPAECANASGGVVHGGLQMAERTLTGELGRGGHNEDGMPGFPTIDRDADCVPEIDDAHLPAALAGSVTFHIARTAP